MSTINLTQSQLKDVKAFCSLNNIEDIDAFISLCFEKGYNVEKYGLLGKTGGIEEKWVEKEVIREKRVEIPIEVIKEVEKIVIQEVIKEVPVEKIIEKPVEIIKEVPVEKVVIQEVIKEVPVEKIVTIYDNSNENELLFKIQQLENKPPQIVEVEKIVEIEKLIEVEKEVIVEKTIIDDEKQKLLQQTLQTLRGQLNLKDQEINKLKEDIEYLKGEIDKPATFLRSSNLKDSI